MRGYGCPGHYFDRDRNIKGQVDRLSFLRKHYRFIILNKNLRGCEQLPAEGDGFLRRFYFVSHDHMFGIP